MATAATAAFSINANSPAAGSVSGPRLDALVEGLVREFLAREKFDEPDEPEPADNRWQEIIQRKTELMNAYTKGELSAATVFPAVQALEAEATI